MDDVLEDGLLLLPPLVAHEEDPACCYEEERKSDDPDTETDDGTVVWAWVRRCWYRSLNIPAVACGGVDGDTSLY